MKPYQMPSPRGRRLAKVTPNFGGALKKPINEEQLPLIVQGMTPGSKQEARVAAALDKLKLEYQYQKPIGGGHFRGGQLVDFWVYTSPLPTPVFVQGTYWHRRAKENEDNIKQQHLQKLYSGRVMENLLLKEEQLGSVEAAYSVLRKALVG